MKSADELIVRVVTDNAGLSVDGAGVLRRSECAVGHGEIHAVTIMASFAGELPTMALRLEPRDAQLLLVVLIEAVHRLCGVTALAQAIAGGFAAAAGKLEELAESLPSGDN